MSESATPPATEKAAVTGRTWIWLALILLLGFGLRAVGIVWGQSYCYFAQEDGIEAYARAVDFAQGQPEAQYLGQPNYNMQSKLPGPLWTLFCLGGLKATGSIQGVLWAMALLNTAFIYLVYMLTARTIGARAGLFAAFFAATFPWAVYYSVWVYNPDVMPFLGALLFLALWQVTIRERSKSVFWVMLLLFAMPQFHMSGLMLIPTVALVLWLSPARVSWPWLAAGVAAGMALYAPYVLGEMAHGWKNTRGMTNGGGGFSVESLKAISGPLSFLVNWAPRWTRTFAEYRELGRAVFGNAVLFIALNVVSFFLAGFLILGGLVAIWKAMRGRWNAPRAAFARPPGIIFLAVIFFVPLLTATISGKPSHTRYQLVLLGPELALAAVAAVRWLDMPRFKRLFLSLLVITTVVNVWLVCGMYWTQGRRIDAGPVFIPGFRKLEMVYQSLKNHAGKDRPVTVDDDAYLAALPPQERVLRDAALIRRYVAVREKENPGKNGPPLVFRLCAAAAVQQADGSVAFSGNGIALIGKP